jgi:UDP-N-acetylmuramate--alanine ligase
MIAFLLVRLNLDPSYIIGGTVKNLDGKNAHAGKGIPFVIEADEYDRMFLGLNPDMIVVNSLEHDHPDCFPTPQEYYTAFVEFVHRLRPGGLLFVAKDNQQAAQLAAETPADTRALTYGTDPSANFSARNLTPNTLGGFDYQAAFQYGDRSKITLAQVRLQVPGVHNVCNSLAALAVVHQLSMLLDLDTIKLVREAATVLSEFSGTGRRFDVQGEVNDITVIDDYAHHPTEIQATLAGARARYPQRRIWAIWQPHTYSRTRALLADFAHSFSQADQVIVTEIYPAREKAQDFDYFSAAQVVTAMAHPAAQMIPTLDEVSQYLLDHLQPGDVLLVLSAGDADQISAHVLAELRRRKV